MSKVISNVRLIWDNDNAGWFARYDEQDQANLDTGLDASDRSNPGEALDEIVHHFSGRVSRDEIAVLN